MRHNVGQKQSRCFLYASQNFVHCVETTAHWDNNEPTQHLPPMGSDFLPNNRRGGRNCITVTSDSRCEAKPRYVVVPRRIQRLPVCVGIENRVSLTLQGLALAGFI